MSDHIMQTYARWPVTIVSGRGCRVTDDSGREFLDLIGGLAVASVGHAHPAVTRAISDQAARLVHVSNLYSTMPQQGLADRLATLTGGYLSFFTNSGAEAIECALKLVRRWGGDRRPRVIAMNNGFHGRTFGALTLTGQPAKQRPFEPLVPGITHVDFDDVAQLEDALDSDVAAVLLEPIQGEAGVVVPQDDYLELVRKLCTEAGALLVLDEIQTGVGRTGRFFAYEHAGVRPDVVCVAKGLAAGLPIGACLAAPEIAAAFEPGDHGTTFGGGPVQCAAALAVLDIVEREELVERAARMGARLMEGLAGVFGGSGSVRGRGLLVGVELATDAAKEVTAVALDRGLLVNNATPTVLRLAPPLVVTEAEIDEGLEILAACWKDLA